MKELLSVLQSVLLARVCSVCTYKTLLQSRSLMQSLLLSGDTNDLLTESLDASIVKKERGEVPCITSLTTQFPLIFPNSSLLCFALQGVVDSIMYHTVLYI